MAAIDYKITDGVLDPPGRTEALHAERLARLPHGYFCYRPDRRLEAPPGPLAARATGCVTFAVFQALPKINAPMIALWARILAEAPGSRLWLKAQGLQEAPSRREFAAAFAAAGVGAERLRLEGWSSFEGYAESLREVDVALDTFPFNGGTTSCHTLWMGVPVVTLRGETAVSRMGLSILGRLGLEALAARTPEEYVATAVALARDLPRLERLRAELRGRMRASALMDETGFARDFGALLESLWREKLAAADA
jgi:predicted O-linked N-acetylglucosamine transferase (SPINDLY family)